MMKHRYIVILFSVLLVLLLLYGYVCSPVHPGLYWLLLLAFLGIEFYGAYFIHSGFHLPSICRAATSDKVIALSFDDGPASETEKILETLDRFEVRATFFCIGHRIRGREATLSKIHGKGHLIGNHSYSHGLLFDLMGTRAMIRDLEQCNAAISQVTGLRPVFFRPPYGVSTPPLARAVKRLGLEVIGWNIRSLDTSIKDPARILARIKARLEPGSIVLMHDSVAGIEVVLNELLMYLKEQNYRVIPLDQLIQKKAYA